MEHHATENVCSRCVLVDFDFHLKIELFIYLVSF